MERNDKRNEIVTTTQTSQSLDIDSPYPLSAAQAAYYAEKGYVKLKRVLEPRVIGKYREEITRKVDELSNERLPLEQRNTYGKAFLQIMNLWTQDAVIREFVFGKRLARMAADLMGCEGVRLYHDQALYKEPHGGLTPWHADQYYWPFATTRTVTAWIPLVPVPAEMGPLAFCPGSHRFDFGRDLEIGDDSEETLKEKLVRFGCDEAPFELGDVSFHSGWTFHRAGPNQSGQMREVFTIIYIDRDTHLAAPRNKNQIDDWNAWCPGVKIGEIVNSRLNPVVYESSGRSC
jgi:ectoine hydroxylase-related dioxygenase (phytanoyl-CoA dioxygenase family)